MKKKYLIFIPFLILFSLILTACGKSIDGKYATVNPADKAYHRLLIENDMATLKISNWVDDGFSVEKKTSTYEGKVDKSKKTITFKNKKIGKLTYNEFKDGLAIFTNAKAGLKYYDSKKDLYDKQIEQFNNVRADLEAASDKRTEDNETYNLDESSNPVPVSKKQEKAIKRYKEARAEKSKELYQQLFAKMGGRWLWTEKVKKKIKDAYTFYGDGKISWIRDWGIGKAEVKSGTAHVEFVFPTNLVKPNDTTTSDKDGANVEDGLLIKLNERKLNQAIEDIKNVTFEEYLQKFGSVDGDEPTYNLRVYDNTGDEFRTLIRIKLSPTNAAAAKISTTDSSSFSSTMEDFVKLK